MNIMYFRSQVEGSRSRSAPSKRVWERLIWTKAHFVPPQDPHSRLRNGYDLSEPFGNANILLPVLLLYTYT